MHIVSCIDGINFNQMNNKIIQMTFFFSYNLQIEIKFYSYCTNKIRAKSRNFRTTKYHILIVQTK